MQPLGKMCMIPALSYKINFLIIFLQLSNQFYAIEAKSVKKNMVSFLFYIFNHSCYAHTDKLAIHDSF